MPHTLDQNAKVDIDAEPWQECIASAHRFQECHNASQVLTGTKECHNAYAYKNADTPPYTVPAVTGSYVALWVDLRNSPMS